MERKIPEDSSKYARELREILGGKARAEFAADNWRLLIEDGELFGGIVYIRYFGGDDQKEFFSFNEYGFLGGHLNLELKNTSRSGINLGNGESTNVDANSLSREGRKKLADDALAMVHRKIAEAEKSVENLPMND